MAPPSDHLRDDPTSPDPQQLEAQNRALRQRIAALEAQLQAMEQSGGEDTSHGDSSTAPLDDDALRHTHKMEVLGTFTAGIAHDFNNVLSIMLGYTDLTLYDVPQGSVAWHNLQEILQAGRRAKDLIQQILTFIRRDEQAVQPTRVSDVINELLKFLRAFLPSTIETRYHLGSNLGWIQSDATQLHQVLMNLCTNAEYVMRTTGGILEVRAESVEIQSATAAPSLPLSSGRYVRFCIRDSGPGMTPDVVSRIFEPYYTTKPQGEGSGMGLSVAKAIITRHGGAINVTSTPGAGTQFDVYLPSLNVDEAALPSEGTPQAPFGRGRILFVDDEQMLADLGYRMLSRLGYDVIAMTDGREALERLRDNPQAYDLLITDQTMPHITGADLIQAAHEIRPDLPTVLCTGYSQVVNAEQAQELGVDAFLMKPLEFPELAELIRQLLQGQAE